MDEVIHSLTAGKIRELLALCGIGDHSEEPIKHHILGISNFVHDTRLQLGLKDAPPLITPRNSPISEKIALDCDQNRGSYRFLPSPEKRRNVNYEGLDRSSTRRKKKTKLSLKKDHATNANIQKDGDTAATREAETQVTLPLTTDAEAHEEAHIAAASFQPGLRSVSSLSDHHGSQSAVETGPPGAETVTHDIVEKILINCVRLNDPLGRYGHRTKETTVTTRIERIQGFVDDIAKLKYPDAVHVIKRENAFSASKDIQARCNETVYWEVIKKGAELLDPEVLPTPKGPLDEFTMAEKVATERFMREAGYGLSLANQRHYRIFWKALFEMRNAGVDKILLYRTKEFDRFCKGYTSEDRSSLIETVRLWEEKYSSHIKQLENQVIQESQGDLTGRLWLSQPHVAQRLEIPEHTWNSACNPWFSREEEVAFHSSGPHEPSSAKPGGYFDLRRGADTMSNKSIFVTLLPKDETFLSVCPIVAVREGDFLGIFAGMIRYSEGCNALYGVPGPKASLWLDYSRVTGTLNMMGVSAPGGESNVCLQWELVEDREGLNTHLTWRVSVRALRTIMPFEEIIRAAPQKEQYIMHRRPDYARRGFMKYGQL